ncbi:uncharacterized protein LOC126456013 [Schistocerca serialis cubense]|uniref:uncharacterized protein LOC126456013 n=1 Tax=Schistocerca serialis cubense TaxID=2023355 RepID=UPI00214E076E|nr:uncharacterized protein LOC126456013 [Schistocerca serialis cubense]
MSQVYENIFRDALKDFRVSEEGLISGYCSSLEEVETLLGQLKTVGFSHCVRSRFKEPSSDVMKSKTKHCFKQMQGHVPIPFFGCAFAVESVWPKYYKSRVSSVPEHLVISCCVKIDLLSIKQVSYRESLLNKFYSSSLPSLGRPCDSS